MRDIKIKENILEKVDLNEILSDIEVDDMSCIGWQDYFSEYHNLNVVVSCDDMLDYNAYYADDAEDGAYTSLVDHLEYKWSREIATEIETKYYVNIDYGDINLIYDTLSGALANNVHYITAKVCDPYDRWTTYYKYAVEITELNVYGCADMSVYDCHTRTNLETYATNCGYNIVEIDNKTYFVEMHKTYNFGRDNLVEVVTALKDFDIDNDDEVLLIAKYSDNKDHIENILENYDGDDSEVFEVLEDNSCCWNDIELLKVLKEKVFDTVDIDCRITELEEE